MYSWSDSQYQSYISFSGLASKSIPIRVELVATVFKKNHFKNFMYIEKYEETVSFLSFLRT